MERKRMLLGAALAAILVLGAACGGDDPVDSGEPAAEDGGGSGSVTLTATNLSFSPPTLEVASGGSIEFVNEDEAKHSFTADEIGVDTDVEASSSTTVDLGDAEPGSYDFVCKYHPDMKGTLEITG